MYEVVITNKGRTIIATKNIKIGTIIIKETPLIIGEDVYDILYKIFNSDNNEYDDDRIIKSYEELVPHKLDKWVFSYDYLKKDMQTLPVYMQDFFLQFSPCRLQLLVAKFYRNAFNFSRNNNNFAPSAILFYGNILNHSCDNNIDFEVDKNGNYIFRTNRDINIGEELCDKYIDVNISLKKRQKILLEQYGFLCMCNKCKIKE